MMGKRFVVCLLLLSGANALADQNTKQARLRELMELQGLAVSQGSPAESIDIWVRHYGEHVTEAELNQIVAYYRSPVGQKDVVAQGLAGERWTAFILERNNKALEAATKGFFEQLNGIVQ